jgi:methionyl-tRNA formyltransferase
MLRVAFAGTPEFALPALDALARSPHQLIGVLTQPDRPAGRGRGIIAGPIKARALELNLPLAQPARLHSSEEQAALRAWSPEILVVVAYGLILPPAVLAIPTRGCLNIHASLLPRWRGAAPIQRAILAGDAKTGVSIMQLEAGLDTGPVYAQRSLAIGALTSAAELQPQLATLGAQLLLETLAQIEAGSARAQPQPAEGVSYAAKLSKSEAPINWQRPALELARQVQAFNPWPVAQCQWAGQALRVWSAEAVAGERGGAAPGTVLGVRPGRIEVACGTGVLGLLRLQAAGRRVVSAGEFANAHALTGQQFT